MPCSLKHLHLRPLSSSYSSCLLRSNINSFYYNYYYYNTYYYDQKLPRRNTTPRYPRLCLHRPSFRSYYQKFLLLSYSSSMTSSSYYHQSLLLSYSLSASSSINDYYSYYFYMLRLRFYNNFYQYRWSYSSSPSSMTRHPPLLLHQRAPQLRLPPLLCTVPLHTSPAVHPTHRPVP